MSKYVRRFNQTSAPLRIRSLGWHISPLGRHTVAGQNPLEGAGCEPEPYSTPPGKYDSCDIAFPGLRGGYADVRGGSGDRRESYVRWRLPGVHR